MEAEKWLKRKYPKTFDQARAFLSDEQLLKFKESKYNLGRLKKPVNEYPKGTLIYFKRSNPVNDYNYPMHLGIAKCKKRLTASGYHSINIFEADFEEIFE